MVFVELMFWSMLLWTIVAARASKSATQPLLALPEARVYEQPVLSLNPCNCRICLGDIQVDIDWRHE